MLKKWILVTGCGVGLWFVAGYFAWAYLVRTTSQSVEQPAVFAPFEIEPVALTTCDSVQLVGWFIKPTGCSPRTPAVILLACLRGNRLNLIERALLYLAQGNSVLLIDLRGTGESHGTPSFGWFEKNDLLAAHAFLIQKGIRQIGLHGISAGAATICYALPELDALHFVVLESCYDQMAHAIRNRIRARFGLPVPFFWPVIIFAQLKFNFQLYALNPIDYVSQLRCPVFLIAGAADPSVLPGETLALYQRIPQPKALWLTPYGHDDFFRKAPQTYKKKLNSFLENYLFEKRRIKCLSEK